MEYQFQPVGYPPSAAFYLFNDHFKAGTTASDDNRRGVEAGIVAAAANGLPANAPVIYAGDYNPTNNTNDQGYKGVITGTGSNNNRGIDPLNPTNAAQDWSTAASLHFETESPATVSAFTGQSTGGMHFRDDFLLHSPAVQSGVGLRYVSGSYLAFGNTSTHQYLGAVTTGDAAAFAAELSGYTPAQAAAVLAELAQVSDHLPVIADYQIIAVPEPSALALVVAGAVLGAGYVRRRAAGRGCPPAARSRLPIAPPPR
jgi:hypothetical protein